MRSSLAGFASCIGLPHYFFAPNEPDDVHIGDDNQTVFKHAFDGLGCGSDLIRLVDYRNHHRHIAHRVKEAFSMLVALGPVAENAAVNGGTGGLHHAELFYDGVVERLAVPLVCFSNENPQEL